MKVGENGRGMASRWYPETLKRRILAMSEVHVRSRISFVEGDGIDVMRQKVDRPDVAFFIDPPYTVAGRRLYTFSDVDHTELFRVASRLKGQLPYDLLQLGGSRKNGCRVWIPNAVGRHAKHAQFKNDRTPDWPGPGLDRARRTHSHRPRNFF